MAITARSIGRVGNQMRVTGTLTCNSSGEAQALTDTKSRLVTFQAFNSDGQESPEISLNSNNGTEDTANGSAYMRHGGDNADVWNYESTFV